MNKRVSQLNTLYDVIEESGSFYIGRMVDHAGAGLHVLIKGHCEEVKPEPAWENITSLCTVLEGGRIYLGESAIADLSHGYRARKVKVFDEKLSGLCSAYVEYDAFIIERIKP